MGGVALPVSWLYDVMCFVLVIVRIYVPSSRTDCNSAVSDDIEKVICVGFWSRRSDILLCSPGTGLFKIYIGVHGWNLWDETWNKRSDRMALRRNPGIRAPCVISPLFSALQCERLVTMSQMLSLWGCFETPLVALPAFMLRSGCLYSLFCYSICRGKTYILILFTFFSLGGWHWWWYLDQSHGFKKRNRSVGY